MIGQWIGFSLRHAAVHEIEPLLGHLFPELQTQLGDRLIEMFYSRLFDGRPYVNLYLKVTDASLGKQAVELACRRFNQPNIQIEEAVYFPQTGRYGGEKMLQFVETFFTCSSSVATALFADGGTLEDKVRLGHLFNSQFVDRLAMDDAWKRQFLRGVEKTWEQYYREQNYQVRADLDGLVAQLQVCLQADEHTAAISNHLLRGYAAALDRIVIEACRLERSELLETPAHANELRAVWRHMPTESAASAQIAIGLMHMNLNKAGIFGELEVAMYRLLHEESQKGKGNP